MPITTSSPSLYWSVLLDFILTRMPSALKELSEHRSFINSSQRRNPANANKHTASNLTSVGDGFMPAASTMACSISTVTGFLLTLGLATILLIPASVTCTNGDELTGFNPAIWCNHDNKACTTSSAAALDSTDSLKCCR